MGKQDEGGSYNPENEWTDAGKLEEKMRRALERSVTRGGVDFHNHKYRAIVRHGGSTSWHVYIVMADDQPEEIAEYAGTLMSGFRTEDQAEKAQKIAENLIEEYARKDRDKG